MCILRSIHWNTHLFIWSDNHLPTYIWLIEISHKVYRKIHHVLILQKASKLSKKAKFWVECSVLLISPICVYVVADWCVLRRVGEMVVPAHYRICSLTRPVNVYFSSSAVWRYICASFIPPPTIISFVFWWCLQWGWWTTHWPPS